MLVKLSFPVKEIENAGSIGQSKVRRSEDIYEKSAGYFSNICMKPLGILQSEITS
jgi:hypothetical protein